MLKRKMIAIVCVLAMLLGMCTVSYAAMGTDIIPFTDFSDASVWSDTAAWGKWFGADNMTGKIENGVLKASSTTAYGQIRHFINGTGGTDPIQLDFSLKLGDTYGTFYPLLERVSGAGAKKLFLVASNSKVYVDTLSDGRVDTGVSLSKNAWNNISCVYDRVNNSIRIAATDSSTGDNTVWSGKIEAWSETDFTKDRSLRFQCENTTGGSFELDNVRMFETSWDLYESFDNKSAETDLTWLSVNRPNNTDFAKSLVSFETVSENDKALCVETVENGAWVELKNAVVNNISPISDISLVEADVKFTSLNNDFMITARNPLGQITFCGGQLIVGEADNRVTTVPAADFTYETDKWYHLKYYYELSTGKIRVDISSDDYDWTIYTSTTNKGTGNISLLQLYFGMKTASKTYLDNLSIKNVTGITMDGTNSKLDKNYSLSDISLSRSDTLTSGEITASVNGSVTGGKSADFVFALYKDTEGAAELQSLQMKTVSGTVNETLNINVPDDGGKYMVKALLWKSDMTPLQASKTLGQ